MEQAPAALSFIESKHFLKYALINRVITFELTQLIWSRYIHVTDEEMCRQTYREMDDLLKCERFATSSLSSEGTYRK